MWECINCSEVHEDSFFICWRCGTTRSGEQPINFLEPDLEEETADECIEDNELERSISQLIFSTTPDLKTHTITEYLGIVSGEAILGVNEICKASLQQGRKIALQEAAVEAVRMGADAVIGISFNYGPIRESMLTVTCIGTAITADRKE